MENLDQSQLLANITFSPFVEAQDTYGLNFIVENKNVFSLAIETSTFFGAIKYFDASLDAFDVNSSIDFHKDTIVNDLADHRSKDLDELTSFNNKNLFGEDLYFSKLNNTKINKSFEYENKLDFLNPIDPITGENYNYQAEFGLKPVSNWLEYITLGSASDYKRGGLVSVDSQGSLYVGGHTLGDIEGQSNLGGYDGFLSKFDNDGNKIWVKQLGSSSHDYVKSVKESSGYIYVSGFTYGSFDGEENSGTSDLFVSKYDGNGNLKWTEFLGGSNSEATAEFGSLTLDSQGNVYIAGSTWGTFYGHYRNSTSDAFYVKLNSLGERQHVQMLSTDNYEQGNDIAIDEDVNNNGGGVYLFGNANGDIIDGDNDTKAIGNTDVYLIKYGLDNTLKWARQLGSTGNENAQSIVIDKNGSVYISGISDGSFDGKSNNGLNAIYITKFDYNGNKKWTRLYGTNGSEDRLGLAVNYNNQLYITGTTNGNLNGEINNGLFDGFISEFSPNGEIIWTQLLGSNKNDVINSISIQDNGNIFVSGFTSGEISGKPVSPSGTHIYVSSLKPYVNTETEGSITLAKKGGLAYIKASGSNTYVPLADSSGTQWGDTIWSGWSVLGAETIGGVNKAFWRKTGTTSYWVSQHDANWRHNGSYTPSDIGKEETAFNIDFDGNGSIGASYVNTETEGSITLAKKGGLAYIKASGSNTYVPLADSSGTQWGDTIWSGWSVLGAETIGGVNKAFWRKTGTTSYWVSQHDANWRHNGSYTPSDIGKEETAFNIDFDGNGAIGISSVIPGLVDIDIILNVNNFLSDDLFSHLELTQLLKKAGESGINLNEFNDLKTIYSSCDKYLSATTKNYSKYIFNAVVNGNTANQWWTGGSSSRVNLGDLYAGATQQHLNRLVGKWFEGSDLPLNKYKGDSARNIPDGNFIYGKSTGSLFVDGIDIRDIYQGSVGTCYLLAAAGSIARKSAESIDNMFIDNNNNTFGIKFYSKSNSEIWVTVNKDIPVNPNNTNKAFMASNSEFSLNGENWVSLLEKGYAQANEIGVFDRKEGYNSYASISGGFGNALTHLTDKASWNWVDSDYYTSSNWSLLKSGVIDRINNGQYLWFGFDDDLVFNDKLWFVGNHAFSLIDYDSDKDWFYLYNPWGERSGSNYHYYFPTTWSLLRDYGAVVCWT